MQTLVIFDIDGTLLKYSEPYFTWRPFRNVLIDTIHNLGFDIAIWTLGEQKYADCVKKRLQNETKIVFAWSDEQSSLSETKRYKNLQKVRDLYPGYKKIILIDDDDVHKQCNHDNRDTNIFISIDCFSTSMLEDKEFLRIGEILKQI